jgi:U3 small nucleolar RNA-associated protein 25
MRQEASAAFICEYSRESEISRGRSRFFHGSKDILLYSGRFHYFRRYSMRGANHIIFYSLPEHPQFYPEMVNLITEATDAASPSSCLVLFTKFEKMALSRIVGEKWSKNLFTNTKETFLFK